MITSEEWRPVVGFEGSYEVSNMGRVRSVDRYITQRSKGGHLQTRLMKECVLAPAINKKRHGYRYVNLRVDGQQTARRVAVLVAAAFVGPRPEGLVTCHRNGVVTDDRADNLRYDTPKNNTADMKMHGTFLFGESSPNARLKTSDVAFIKRSSLDSETLGARFGVHPGHINNIRRGVRWAHV